MGHMYIRSLDNQYYHFRLAEMESEVEALTSLNYVATYCFTYRGGAMMSLYTQEVPGVSHVYRDT